MIAKLVLKRVFLISFFLCLWLVPRGLQAQTSLYWDNNFSSDPSGPWDTTSPLWSSIPGGVAPGSQTNWVQGDSAVFSASGLPGSEQSFNVALTQNLTVANLTYTGGNGGSQLFIAAGGNTINMANTQMVVAVDPGTKLFLEPVIADPIVDPAGTLILQSGNLVLLGANTYSGGTVITGTVTVGNDAGLGAAAGGITLSNGELLTATTGFSSARAINLGFGVGENINTLAAVTGTATYTGVISGDGNLTVGDGTNDGKVVLSNGANTYFGGTTVVGGATLSVNTDAELGDISGGITLMGGELLTTGMAFSSARAVTLNPSRVGANTLAAATATTGTYTGVISGEGGLTVGDGVNTGMVVLANGANTNTYSGGTTVVLGATLSVDRDAELGDTSGGITLTGGELLTPLGLSSARTITLNTSTGANTLATAAFTGATYSGVVSGNGGLTIGDGVNTGRGSSTAATPFWRYHGCRRQVGCRHRFRAGGHQRRDHAHGGRIAHHRDGLFQRTDRHA